MEALLETWRINARINLYLLEAIPPEQLSTSLAKGKSALSGFSHVHNVRLMWLKAAAPALHEGQTKFEPGEGDAESFRARLSESAEAIEKLLASAGSPEGKIKGFKPHAAAFLGYLIAHESFHRAQIELALRQAGTPLSDKIAYGTWEWGSR